MEHKNLLCRLHGVIIPLLHGIKYYTPTKVMEHKRNKVDMNFILNFIFFVKGSRIHDS